MSGHNNPPVIVEFTQDQAEFIIKNCDSNINFSLALLQAGLSRPESEKLVSLIENFKAIKEAVEDASG